MRITAILLFFALSVQGIFAQSQRAAQKHGDFEKGFSNIETFQGTFNSDSNQLKVDSRVGYDFNPHFGIFVGVPIYFANSSATATTTPAVPPATTTTTTSTSNGGFGNSYLGLAFKAPVHGLGYTSTITFSAPTGSVNDGFSSGRGNADWDNYLDHSFNRFTPFFEGGISNTVPDSSLFTRPFTSLGVVTHLEEGGEFDLIDHVSVGGSGYEIVPFGTQKVFSKVVGQGQSGKGPGNPNRVFDGSPETVGADLTRENGFNSWVAFQTGPMWRLEVGYTRSITYDLNSFAFNLGVNVGKMIRAHKGM